MNKNYIILLISILIICLLVIKCNGLPLYKFFLIYSVTAIANPIYRYTSLVGNQPIYEDSLLASAQILTKNWKVFRDEVLTTYKTYTTIKGDVFFGDIVRNKSEWKKLYIKWHSKIDPIARKKCPNSCRIIESLPDVKVAMFSVLSPHAKIYLHNGPYKGCLRYHLGLITPNSDECYIIIGGYKYSWRDGKGILLDDTYDHEVENNTNHIRIILFCDLLRPMSFVGKHLNNLLINNFGHLTTRGN